MPKMLEFVGTDGDLNGLNRRKSARRGAKRALKQQQVWAIRFWLDQHRRLRNRALFDFAIDSKLRGCDVVKVRIGDVVSDGRARDRAIVVQQKTNRPVQLQLMDAARKTIAGHSEPHSALPKRTFVHRDRRGASARLTRPPLLAATR
jgi:hypothetical protein